jgi:hypothetical protein
LGYLGFVRLADAFVSNAPELVLVRNFYTLTVNHHGFDFGAMTIGKTGVYGILNTVEVRSKQQ